MMTSRRGRVVAILALCGAVSACADTTKNPATNADAPAPTPAPETRAAPEPEPEAAPEPAPEPIPEPEPLVKAPDGTAMQPCADGPEDMACIPGGAFLRGSDRHEENSKPQAEVWVQSFWMDRNEVTFAQYKACEKAGGCDESGPRYIDFDRPTQPINGISWFDARKYCEAQGKRLPTEAEWEKAARGTDGRLYPWGDDKATCKRAIIKDRKGRGCGRNKRGNKPETGIPWEVGSLPPNQFGLFDMAGNSWEWVADWYTESYTACGDDCVGTDPKGPCGGADECPGHRLKIVRGGSWYWPASHATTVWRRAHYPKNRPYHHFGFRCAASLDQVTALAGTAEKTVPAVPEPAEAAKPESAAP